MTTRTDFIPLNEADLAASTVSLGRLRDTLNNVLFGQEHLIEMVTIGLLSRGHLLLEGLPGLGKTELVKGLAKALQLDSKRIQFTPDLLPGDITGNPVLQEIDGKRTFVFQPGPLFTNLVLADEINRASPKTQSALLEAMQERRVTVMGESHVLPSPFFVLATQNPIELEGTYPLPEAQLDRFLLKIEVRRSGVETLEKIVLNRKIGIEPEVPTVLTRDELNQLLDLSQRIYLPPVVANYIARLVDGTHTVGSLGIKYGASPRPHGRGPCCIRDPTPARRMCGPWRIRSCNTGLSSTIMRDWTGPRPPPWWRNCWRKFPPRNSSVRKRCSMPSSAEPLPPCVARS